MSAILIKNNTISPKYFYFILNNYALFTYLLFNCFNIFAIT